MRELQEYQGIYAYVEASDSHSPLKYVVSAMKNPMVPKIDDVRYEAIQAIVDRLRIGKAVFFIRETMSQPIDYLNVKEQLFGTMTVADICTEIQQKQLPHR